jgi:phytoene dehydrogenase-like protein
MNDATLDVVVAGAGLAGLAAGVAAARSGARVVVVDGHPAGGRARTDSRRGFRFNQGAHALYVGGHATRVLGELGVPIPPGGSPSTDQWGIDGSRSLVSRLPGSPRGVLGSKHVDLRGKLQLGRFLVRLRKLDPASVAGLSAEAWIRSLGLRPGAAAMVRLLSHVAAYCDDLEAMSADAVVGQLQLAMKPGAVRYMDGGWQTMVDGLLAAARDAGVEVRIGSAAVAVEARGDGRRTVRLADGTVLDAGAVVIATGGPAAVASLLPEPPHWGLIGPPATVACLDLGLRRRPDKELLFGVDQPIYLSTHSGAAAGLAPEGNAVVHLMRYGARDAETDRAELWALARAAGIGEDDVIEQRFLAHMVVTQAVPVPGSGLAGRPSVDGAGVDGVYVAGDWVGPDGLLGDAALASGQRAGVRAASRARSAVGAVPA